MRTAFVGWVVGVVTVGLSWLMAQRRAALSQKIWYASNLSTAFLMLPCLRWNKVRIAHVGHDTHAICQCGGRG